MIPYFTFEKIDLGFISIKVWGMALVIAFLFGLVFSYFEFKRKGLEKEHLLGLACWSLLGAILGGRVFYVITHLDYFKENIIEIIAIWQGGFVFYGGFLFAFLFDWFYLKKHQLDIWRIADAITPGLALGLFVGRIGCFLIHDHLGKVMKHPLFFGVNLDGQIRHEPAMYESLFGLAVFLVLWFLRRKLKKPGILFFSFLISYAVFRFFSDFLREYDLRWQGLTGAQWISLIIILSFLYYLWYGFKKRRETGGVGSTC